MHSSTFLAFPLLLLLSACGANHSATTEDANSAADAAVTTSGEPMLQGSGDWTNLLADNNLDAWHSYNQDEPGSAWKIDEEGVLYLDTSNKGEHGVEGGGDLVTDESFENYELELEWKIGECGNSGIIYNIVESDDLDYPWLTGPEMQILDNSCHPDAEIVTHRAGDLYDMITGEPENVRPAGEWNRVRLVVTDGRVEQWQNGERLLTYNNTGPEWEAMIADSKFKDFERFGKSTSGKIGLQDHGDPVWFRNIRIRELDTK
ncbi:3-keto-disaccharide hydrolase [Neolewinella litorea]|uniref:DUF1080 domain-containing protein n=1 Tax=Neolewinella litorea TaxID=2562452 RepID=A0A4S4NJG5_9BACT|nr:DUF1080 domain-containing protein [Neolewinella litorea]THH39909.1 DUF1080 domain-containing protein [Neolewinella litorea]